MRRASRLPMTLETARANGVDFVVVDTPARSEGAALAAARASDLVIIPCRPRDFLESLAVPVCLQTIGQRVTFGNAGTLGLSPLASRGIPAPCTLATGGTGWHGWHT